MKKKSEFQSEKKTEKVLYIEQSVQTVRPNSLLRNI